MLRAAALDIELELWPALALTKRCMSRKVSICRPSIATIRSPGWKPGGLRRAAGCTASTRAAVVCLP